MIVVSVGVFFGIVSALLLGRLIEGLLFGVSSNDARTLVVAPLVLLLAASIAIAIPVYRYTRVDPVQVMRAE